MSSSQYSFLITNSQIVAGSRRVADSLTVNLLHNHFLTFLVFPLIGEIKLSLAVQMALLTC